MIVRGAARWTFGRERRRLVAGLRDRVDNILDRNVAGLERDLRRLRGEIDRGIGDAWDSGEWAFRNGDFVLTRFEFDPTYGDPLPDAPESYVVYEAGR